MKQGRIDIHDLKHRYEVALEGLEASARLTFRNKETIRKFLMAAETEGVGVARRCTYAYWLKHLGILLDKDFSQANQDDVRQVVAQVERSSYSEWTKNTLKVTLKRFFKWLRGSDEGYPPEVKWLRTNEKSPKNPARGDTRLG